MHLNFELVGGLRLHQVLIMIFLKFFLATTYVCTAPVSMQSSLEFPEYPVDQWLESEPIHETVLNKEVVGFVETKRSVLTNVPAWVKWSLQTSTQRGNIVATRTHIPRMISTVTPRQSQTTEQQTESAAFVDRSSREGHDYSERPTEQLTSTNKSSNVVCFFNPVSCFGRRQAY